MELDSIVMELAFFTKLRALTKIQFLITSECIFLISKSKIKERDINTCINFSITRTFQIAKPYQTFWNKVKYVLTTIFTPLGNLLWLETHSW